MKHFRKLALAAELERRFAESDLRGNGDFAFGHLGTGLRWSAPA